MSMSNYPMLDNEQEASLFNSKDTQSGQHVTSPQQNNISQYMAPPMHMYNSAHLMYPQQPVMMPPHMSIAHFVPQQQSIVLPQSFQRQASNDYHYLQLFQNPELQLPPNLSLSQATMTVLNDRIEAVNVRDPCIKSSSLDRFTTYEVRGHTANGVEFSSRKRYTDFEILRSILSECMPGVFLSPLPAKQQIGRFDKDFIESRRIALQTFIESLLGDSIDAGRSEIFRAWLNLSDMTQFKNQIESKTVSDFVANYRFQFFKKWSQITPVVDDSGMFALKTHILQLQTQCKQMSLTLKSALDAAERIQKDTVAFDESYEGFLMLEESIPELKQHADRIKLGPMAELLFGRNHSLSYSKVEGFKKLYIYFENENCNCTAMLESIAQIEELPQAYLTHQSQLQRLYQGDASALKQKNTSSFFSFFAKAKTVTVEDVATVSQQCQILEEFHYLSRTVLVRLSAPQFMKNSVNNFNNIVSEYFSEHVPAPGNDMPLAPCFF